MELIRPLIVGRIATSAASSTQLLLGLTARLIKEEKKRQRIEQKINGSCDTFEDGFPSKAVASQLVFPHS